MSSIQILGLILLIVGIIAMVYRGFTYTEETHDVDFGPLDIEVEEKERVTIPLWASIAAVIAGVVMLMSRRRAHV